MLSGVTKVHEVFSCEVDAERSRFHDLLICDIATMCVGIELA